MALQAGGFTHLSTLFDHVIRQNDLRKLLWAGQEVLMAHSAQPDRALYGHGSHVLVAPDVVS